MNNPQLFTQEMIRQLMQADLHDNAEDGHSQTITLESKTFNRILLYILKHESRIPDKEEEQGALNLEIKLDGVLKECKKEFENVLDLLDKKLN